MDSSSAAAHRVQQQHGDAVGGKDGQAQAGLVRDKAVRLIHAGLSGAGHHISPGDGPHQIPVDLMVLHQGGGVGPRRRAEAAEILRHPFRGVPPVSTQVQAVPGSGRDAAQPGGEAMGADGWIKAATGVKRDALTGAQGDLHRCAPPLPRCKDLSTLLYPKILRLTTRYKGEKRARFPGGAGAFPNGALRRAAARDLPRSRKRAPCTGAGRNITLQAPVPLWGGRLLWTSAKHLSGGRPVRPLKST